LIFSPQIEKSLSKKLAISTDISGQVVCRATTDNKMSMKCSPAKHLRQLGAGSLTDIFTPVGARSLKYILAPV